MSTRPKEKPSGKEQPKDEDAVPTETSDLDSPPTKERWLNEMWVNIIALENKMTNALKRWEHGRQPQTDAEAHEISDIYLDALCLIQNVLSGTQLPKEITKRIRNGTWPYASFILTPLMERLCVQRGIDSHPITIFGQVPTIENHPKVLAVTRQLLYHTDTGPSATADDGGFTVERLRYLTGLANTALNGYAKRSHVPTPSRGKRNHRYTREQMREILQTIIAHSSESKVVRRCQEALEKHG